MVTRNPKPETRNQRRQPTCDETHEHTHPVTHTGELGRHEHHPKRTGASSKKGGGLFKARPRGVNPPGRLSPIPTHTHTKVERGEEGGGESAAQQTLGARAKGGGGSGEASAQRWSRAFRVRAALVSSGGVPPSLPGTPAGWLPGAKRVGRLLWSRGHERVPERGLDSPKHHRAGACCFIEIMGNSQK